MHRLPALAALLLLWPLAIHAAPPSAPDGPRLAALLAGFLAGASANDAAVHERFWADDLIYTGSSGRRVGKAEILADVRAAAPPGPGDPKVVYTAEDVRIQQYGGTAIVAFRLVATTARGDSAEVARYLNSGTFVKRRGRWQAVNWQATRLPAEAAAPPSAAGRR